MGFSLLDKEMDWELGLFMGIFSLMANKRCSLERVTVRLHDHSQAHPRRTAEPTHWLQFCSLLHCVSLFILIIFRSEST